MALFELLLPRMGESVAEATIIKWLKMPGEMIEPDDSVVEIATDKVDSDVSSPVKGKLKEQLFNDGEVAKVGAVIALIETEAGESTAVPTPTVQPEANHQTEKVPVKEASAEKVPVKEALQQPVPGLELLQPKPAAPVSVKDSIRFYSPLVRSIAAQENIGQEELDQISGTGSEGRLTKDDLLDYLQKRNSPAQASSPSKPIENAGLELVKEIQSTHNKPVGRSASSFSSGDEIIEMDRMRKMIADHMVISKQTSPHVTSFIETDVTNLVQWREKHKAAFEKREGEKITFTPIFIEAVAKALKTMPMVNVSVNGTQIIVKKNINIGMATALPTGNLIVPVIKNADELNLLGLSKAVNDLASRARNNKLLPEEVKSGTFTITNIGSFGNLMGTPIIYQPQAAILAVGVIKKKPAVIETESGDMIAIRHLMFLSLSFDHRVIDGALGGMFLKKVSDYLENWDVKRSI